MVKFEDELELKRRTASSLFVRADTLRGLSASAPAAADPFVAWAYATTPRSGAARSLTAAFGKGARTANASGISAIIW